MHRSSQNDRVKSLNLLEHLAPERRRAKPNPSSTQSLTEDPKVKNNMVHDVKKIETGILVGGYSYCNTFMTISNFL